MVRFLFKFPFSRFKNPFKPREKLERPKKCEKLHTKEPNKMGFLCAEITQADVESFREKLYRTTEKRDQHDFLYNFIIPSQCKQSKGNSKINRMVNNVYKIEKADGEVVQVCLENFSRISGYGKGKFKPIFMRRFKNDLLIKGDENLFRPLGMDAEHDLAIERKKEKLLNLEEGQLKSFAQAIIGIDAETIQKPIKNLRKSKKEKRSHKSGKRSRKNLDYELAETESMRNEEMCDNQLLDDLYTKPLNIEEDRLETKRNFLNLPSFEVCRVCLSNKKSTIPLFRKPKNMKSKPADLLEYCLSISIDEEDNLPQKICKKCYENVKTACKVKFEWTKSSKIMEDCLEECDSYNVGETVINDVLNCYTDIGNENSKKRKFEEETAQYNYTLIDPMEIKEEKIDMEPEIEGVCESNDESDENSDDEISDQQTFEETPQQKSKAEEYAGLRPRMCFLCNTDFKTTAEDHFQNAHPLVKFERCTK